MANFQNIEFWPGMSKIVDMSESHSGGITVKGVACPRPMRFLEIYANSNSVVPSANLEQCYFPRVDGKPVVIGDVIDQPPFTWRDARGDFLQVSFSYNSCAIHRIIDRLARLGCIDDSYVECLTDKACLLLAGIYKGNGYRVIQNINNNINMGLISVVIERVVGRRCYNSSLQELDFVSNSAQVALVLAENYQKLCIRDLMHLSICHGIGFINNVSRGHGSVSDDLLVLGSVTDRLMNNALSIDDRDCLLGMIDNAGVEKNGFTLSVIFDDTIETVVDMLWMQKLLVAFPCLRLVFIINESQVSINFSSHLLGLLFASPVFAVLAKEVGQRVSLVVFSCQLVSFQANYLPARVMEAIDKSDAVFVKGANFFETCQFRHKDCFYSFVVHGLISRTCTGICDGCSVFARVPAGNVGYNFDFTGKATVRLIDVVNNDSESII